MQVTKKTFFSSEPKRINGINPFHTVYITEGIKGRP